MITNSGWLAMWWAPMGSLYDLYVFGLSRTGHGVHFAARVSQMMFM